MVKILRPGGERNILKWISKKQVLIMSTGLKWLKTNLMAQFTFVIVNFKVEK
jgi:hypothetical protein